MNINFIGDRHLLTFDVSEKVAALYNGFKLGKQTESEGILDDKFWSEFVAGLEEEDKKSIKLLCQINISAK